MNPDNRTLRYDHSKHSETDWREQIAAAEAHDSHLLKDEGEERQPRYTWADFAFVVVIAIAIGVLAWVIPKEMGY